MKLSPHVRLGDKVATALDNRQPVVALETAVTTHGLPHPFNLSAMSEMEQAVREVGAVAATCLLYQGTLLIGADSGQVQEVANDLKREKVSVRDLAMGLASGISGGLTVSATLFAASLAGIQVFATGGIGGVHLAHEPGDPDQRILGAKVDVSVDLDQLSKSPVVTVCAGAKSVLDIPATLERLETLGVPVYGYQTSDFPAFYTRSSGIPVQSVEEVELIGQVAREHWGLGLRTALVVGNPIPQTAAVDTEQWEQWLHRALIEMSAEAITGKAITPYLLERAASYSQGRTVEANLALLRNNARLAGEIAVSLAS